LRAGSYASVFEEKAKMKSFGIQVQAYTRIPKAGALSTWRLAFRVFSICCPANMAQISLSFRALSTFEG
jgi:hypothetical protein